MFFLTLEKPHPGFYTHHTPQLPPYDLGMLQKCSKKMLPVNIIQATIMFPIKT